MDPEQSNVQAPSNSNQENSLLVKCLKVSQLLLTAACLAISFTQAFASLPNQTRYKLAATNLGLSFPISALIWTIACITGRIPMIGTHCCCPLVEVLAISNMIMSFMAFMVRRGSPGGCNFHIPSMCLGVTLATFVGRLQEMLGMLFGHFNYPQPPNPARQEAPNPAQAAIQEGQPPNPAQAAIPEGQPPNPAQAAVQEGQPPIPASQAAAPTNVSFPPASS